MLIYKTLKGDIMYIDENKVKKHLRPIGEGTFSKIYKARYKRKKYAQKIFNFEDRITSKEQILRFEALCKINNGSNFLLPKYLIGNERHGLESYLMDYYEGKEFKELYGQSFKKRLNIYILLRI